MIDRNHEGKSAELGQIVVVGVELELRLLAGLGIQDVHVQKAADGINLENCTGTKAMPASTQC